MARRSTDDAGFEIVATLGPRSFTLVSDLVAAGCTALRLNASHMAPEDLAVVVARARAVCPSARIVIDLQGSKMRLDAATRREMMEGERVVLAASGSAALGADALIAPHPELYRQVRPGETIVLDDARVQLKVIECVTDALVAVVVEGGPLVGRKGVNVVEHPVDLEDLAASDRAVIDALADAAGVEWALSFVKDADDLRRLRRHLPPGSVCVAKIERAEALAAMDGIVSSADSVWICRGDLAAQVGEGPMAAAVGELRPRDRPRPVLMAGQVLEHLTRHRHPTRSEVCHVYDLWHRGYAGIVLSDETAIGDAPAHAVAQARRLIDDLERLRFVT